MRRDQESRRRRRVLAAVAALVALSACSDDEVTTSTSAASTTAASTVPASTTPASTTAAPTTAVPTTGAETTVVSTVPTTQAETTVPAETMQLSVYFVRDEHVALVHRDVPKTVATSRAVLGELLGGPTAAEAALGMTTTVPSGTELNAVSVDAGIAHVELSDTFGSGGGSLSMMARLAQVVYTLTQFSTVEGVVFESDGVPIEVFGSEGIVLDQPLARADFEDLTPAIFVDGPAPFDTVGPQVRVHGTSNVFEATFMVRLTDSTGEVVYEHYQMATSGTGTRGTFDFIIDAAGGTSGAATLRLWEPSAKDGSDTNVVEIPIELDCGC